MRLKNAWANAAKVADKSNGVPDVDLKTHLEQTGQTHLPQAELLQGCFDHLRKQDLLEEAYLRGSLGRGHADIHSDIDLFAVVNPKKIDQAFDAVKDFLSSKGRIVVECHDRLVENYGGIGFMFVFESRDHGNKSFQFDFYMALKGTPPAKPTNIKPRMFAKNPAEKWTETYGQPAEELPANAKAFIKRHTSGSSRGERMELLMKELLINLYVTQKHIMREQVSRTVVDNHGVVTSAIEFMQLMTGYKSNGYSPVYLGDEIVKYARENGDKPMQKAAHKLEKLFYQPMDTIKLVDTLDYAVEVFSQAFPTRYKGMKESVAYFRDKVLYPQMLERMAEIQEQHNSFDDLKRKRIVQAIKECANDYGAPSSQKDAPLPSVKEHVEKSQKQRHQKAGKKPR